MKEIVFITKDKYSLEVVNINSVGFENDKCLMCEDEICSTDIHKSFVQEENIMRRVYG